MKTLGKYSGIFLLLTGVLHVVIGLIKSWAIWCNIVSDGFINSVGNDIERGFVLWFLLAGVLFILLGYTLHYYIKKEQQPAPLLLGYLILIVSVLTCFILPRSGAWLLIPQGIIIICANKQSNKSNK